MENVKAYAQKQLTLVATDPVSFAFNALGSAVAIWFASIILNYAIRIAMDSYAIITSAL
jgi:hypothetical protein